MNLPRRISLRSFFGDFPTRSYQVSPDGRMISFLKKSAGCLNLFVYSGPGSRPKPVTKHSDHDILSYCWKGQFLVYEMSAETGQGTHFYRINPRTGRKKDLTPLKDIYVDLVDDLNGVSDQEILIEIGQGGSLPDVFRLSVGPGPPKMLRAALHPDVTNFGIVKRWIVDNGGQVLGAITIKGASNLLLMRSSESLSFHVVRAMDFQRSIDYYAPVYFNKDNSKIFAVSNMRRDRDKAALVTIDPNTGREVDCLYKNRSVDVDTFAFSRRRRVITHVLFNRAKPGKKIFDRRTAELFRVVKQRLGNNTIKIVSSDLAENKFILLASSDTMPGTRYLFRRPSGTLEKLSDLVPSLKGHRLVPVRPIKFFSRDRLTIHGYLTLPHGRKRKWLPLVLNVHGGPEQRTYWDYQLWDSAEVQFLANRGYAVMQVNYRGSIGYGRSFWIKGFKERGRKMQDDLTDAVKWLIRRRVADPHRIVIYGKSYGGFCALAGITFTPNLYRGAIDYSGVSDWLTWLDEFLPDEQYLLPQFYIKVGDPRNAKDRARLEAFAPALHAERIKAPLLIAHGAQDMVANKTEADQMVAALLIAAQSGHNLDLEYMVKNDEAHLFETHEQNRLEFYQAVEAFLAKHLH
jgi:dipeptidyl aminopeptidase/acylaminoacyl peptidase